MFSNVACWSLVYISVSILSTLFGNLSIGLILDLSVPGSRLILINFRILSLINSGRLLLYNWLVITANINQGSFYNFLHRGTIRCLFVGILGLNYHFHGDFLNLIFVSRGFGILCDLCKSADNWRWRLFCSLRDTLCFLVLTNNRTVLGR